MKVLFSGFEAFGERDINPTSLLMSAIERKEVPMPKEMIVDQVILPVTFKDSYQKLKERIDIFNPDVVICFGLAEKRDSISLESVAVNLMDARIPDNNGEQPKQERINCIGADSYSSSLPLGGFEASLTAAKIPVSQSQNAGEYVCNYLFYRLMEDNQDTGRLCGFVHVPLLSDHAGENEPSISWEHLKQSVSVMLNYLTYE